MSNGIRVNVAAFKAKELESIEILVILALVSIASRLTFLDIDIEP